MNSKRIYSAAAKVGEIEDLLTNILLRLPSKSLIKFKCVSKEWLSLISSYQFCISHNRIHHGINSTPKALLLNKGFNNFDEFQVITLKQESVPSFDFMKAAQLKILQSCNGLLLCRSSLKVHQKMKISGEENCVIKGFVYFICNPTTRQFKMLCYPASAKEKLRINYLISVSLAFDPSSSPHYKIIFILDLCKRGLEFYLLEIFVYSSDDDSWNSRTADVIKLRLEFLNPPTLGIGFRDGVFCNGAIHWSICDGSILYFLFDNWTFKKISLPVELKVRYFGESQGHLHVIAYKYWYHGSNYDVLEMAADYSGWIMKYHMDLQSISKGFPVRDWKFSILSIIVAKNEEESVIVLAIHGRVMSYNLLRRTFENICEIELMPPHINGLLDYEGDSYQYFDSLIRA